MYRVALFFINILKNILPSWIAFDVFYKTRLIFYRAVIAQLGTGTLSNVTSTKMRSGAMGRVALQTNQLFWLAKISWRIKLHQTGNENKFELSRSHFNKLKCKRQSHRRNFSGKNYLNRRDLENELNKKLNAKRFSKRI